MSITILDEHDRTELEEQIGNKLNKSGFNPDKYLGTDADGNVVEKEGPDSSQNTNSGLSQPLRIAIYNLLMDAAYQSAGHEAEKAALVELLTGGSTEPDEPVIPDEPDLKKTLSSISADYYGGEVAVGTAVNDLTGIVVKSYYSDGTSEIVTEYTLSGTISEGENTITVSYGGKTATFTIVGYVAVIDEEWTQSAETTWTAGGFLNASTGEMNVTGSTQAASDFIEIPEGANAIKNENMNSLLICYYDADKKILTSVNASYSGGGTYGSICTDENGDEWRALTNANAKYIRLSQPKDYQPSTITFKHMVDLGENVTPVVGQLYSYTLGDDFGIYVGDASPYANCNGMEYLNIRPVQRRQFIFYDHNHSVLSTVNPVNNAGNNVAIPSGACYFRCGSHMYQRMLVKFADAELTTW